MLPLSKAADSVYPSAHHLHRYNYLGIRPGATEGTSAAHRCYGFESGHAKTRGGSRRQEAGDVGEGFVAFQAGGGVGSRA